MSCPISAPSCQPSWLHEKSRDWEVQGVSIEGLTFCNLDEMETCGQKVQNKGANGVMGGDKG